MSERHRTIRVNSVTRSRPVIATITEVIGLRTRSMNDGIRKNSETYTKLMRFKIANQLTTDYFLVHLNLNDERQWNLGILGIGERRSLSPDEGSEIWP